MKNRSKEIDIYRMLMFMMVYAYEIIISTGDVLFPDGISKYIQKL